jgi:hypothetical protein
VNTIELCSCYRSCYSTPGVLNQGFYTQVVIQQTVPTRGSDRDSGNCCGAVCHQSARDTNVRGELCHRSFLPFSLAFPQTPRWAVDTHRSRLATVPLPHFQIPSVQLTPLTVRLFCPRFRHHRPSPPLSTLDHVNDVRLPSVRALSFASRPHHGKYLSTPYWWHFSMVMSFLSFMVKLRPNCLMW